MTNTSKLALIGAVASAAVSFGLASPASAQSYSFPTYAYEQHLQTEATAPAAPVRHVRAERGALYNSVVVPAAPAPSAYYEPEWYVVGRGNTGH
jgi:hypothetical protein